MNDKTRKPCSITIATDYDTKRDAELLNSVPQSVRQQVYGHRRKREPGRELLIRHMEQVFQARLYDYDNETRQAEHEILQIYEMSLQSKTREGSRKQDRERER